MKSLNTENKFLLPTMHMTYCMKNDAELVKIAIESQSALSHGMLIIFRFHQLEKSIF